MEIGRTIPLEVSTNRIINESSVVDFLFQTICRTLLNPMQYFQLLVAFFEKATSSTYEPDSGRFLKISDLSVATNRIADFNFSNIQRESRFK